MDIKQGEIIVTREMLHKIKNVLRYKKGDDIIFFQSRSDKQPGKKYFGRIVNISNEQITVKIIDCMEISAPAIFTSLYLSLIKSRNFEAAIQKATELGIKKIIPLAAQRSVVKVKKEAAFKKHGRWEAIAVEAAAQCKRGDIPTITQIISANELKKIRDSAQIKIVCDEKAGVYLKDYLKEFCNPISISAAVGPEGGFTKEETAIFNSSGFKSVLLGKNILRSETVPIYLMSIFQYEFGI
jgi:16S rRNA (uracil1498-N3)-methyltransferase